jgi:hypothetical protein
MWYTRLELFALAAVLAVWPAANAAPACAPGDVLYMALQPVQELVGYNAETRQQFLDRLYPGWQEDKEGLVRTVPSTGDEALRIALAASPEMTIERTDLIVEASFEYVDRDERRRELVGHRVIARYLLEAGDAQAEIAVPTSVVREPGALLVAVTTRPTDGAAARSISIAAVPLELSRCPRHIYTHDRFTAVRFNRALSK